MFGDQLFNALKDVSGINSQQLQSLQQTGNRIGAISANAQALVSPSGSLDPGLFARSGPGGGFTLLPHESASLYMSAQTQLFTTNRTAVTNWDPTSNAGATWEKGFRVDSTLGRIYVDGVTRETVLFIQMSGYTEPGSSVASGSGHLEMAYMANDGSWRPESVQPAANSSWIPNCFFLTHVRSLPENQTWYQMEIYGSSGILDNRATSFAGGLFTITRLR